MGEKISDMGAIHVKKMNLIKNTIQILPLQVRIGLWRVAGAGIKDEIVPDELILHSMEHGAVVVWYREDLEQSDIDKIKVAFQNASGKKIMLARKDLDVPVALTSWNYLFKTWKYWYRKNKRIYRDEQWQSSRKATI